MKKKRDAILIIICLLLVLSVAAVMYVIANNPKKPASAESQKDTSVSTEEHRAGSETETSTDAASEEETETMTEADKLAGTEDIVFFGVDTRSTNLGRGTRSDSLMIIHLDHNEKKIRILSIYRDTMLHVEGFGYKKITNVHSYGGPDLSISTINENLDLNIKDYMTVNFNTVGDLVDMAGGVDQDINSAEAGDINRLIDELNKVRGTSSAHITSPGTYHLDGTQAVAFSRIRHTAGGDYKRAERQRTILFKLFKSCKDLGRLEQVKILENLMHEINTSLSKDKLLSLIYNLSSYQIDEMTAYPRVFYGGSVEGHWVEVPCTLIDMNAGLHEFLYGDKDYKPSTTVKKYSAELRSKVKSPNTNLNNTY